MFRHTWIKLAVNRSTNTPTLRTFFRVQNIRHWSPCIFWNAYLTSTPSSSFQSKRRRSNTPTAAITPLMHYVYSVHMHGVSLLFADQLYLWAFVQICGWPFINPISTLIESGSSGIYSPPPSSVLPAVCPYTSTHSTQFLANMLKRNVLFINWLLSYWAKSVIHSANISIFFFSGCIQISLAPSTVTWSPVKWWPALPFHSI